MVRVLIAHNAYLLRGGEDSVVEAEYDLLLARGHAVEIYRRSNKTIATESRISLASQAFWSKNTTKDISKLIESFKPDIIHVHNTFPLISPSLYWVAAKAGVPVVQTLHNFRLLCPQAMFLREGKVCEDCLGHLPWRGILHGCYRESNVQTAVLSGVVTIHRAIGTWSHKVSRYIALNDFCRQKFIEGGLPGNRIVVKPNFVDFPAPDKVSRQGFLFVGRLSPEKGVEILVNAIRKLSNITVHVAGTGPMRDLLEGVKCLIPLGEVAIESVRIEMGKSIALILPSIWYENFPRTLVEAFGSGLPVIASRIGALAELVEDGVTGMLFEPGNPDDLAEKLDWAMRNPERMLQMGVNARKKYEAEFTGDINYHQLISIYQDAIREFGKV